MEGRTLVRLARALPAAGVLLGVVGCVDLDVENLNDPDRARAVGQPGDVEALIAGSFTSVYAILHSQDGPPPGAGGTGAGANIFPNAATEMTTTANGFAARENVIEPRIPLDNDPAVGSTTGPWGARRPWTYFNRAVSSANDGLQIIESTGMVIEIDGIDQTNRARAFAKLIQGWGWGYQSLIYDKVYYLPETEAVAPNPLEQAGTILRPNAEVRDLALEAIDAAITLAGSGSFTLPAYAASRLFFATPNAMTSAQFIQLANTLAARILVYHPRTKEQRNAVDWQRVLQYTANGLTTDFEVVLASGFRSSTLYARAISNTVGCQCYRLDQRLIGHADQSGAYQAWLATPLQERTRFDIVTPDRRITGDTPTSHGAYTWYRADDNGFLAGVGTYLFSGYQYARHAHKFNLSPTQTGSDVGTALLMTVDENRLLRAEALLRTGDLAGAATLINVSRTRAHTLRDGVTYDGLPPVTAAGVPQSATCVPRTDSGACGDLMAALWWERMIEGLALDTTRGFFDSRGFGLMRDFGFVEVAVPGNELAVLNMELYTFGGEGGQSSAVYAPATMADL